MKKFIIISNWKMNLPDNIEGLVEISKQAARENLEISIAPPFTEIAYISSLLKNNNLSVSAQNVSFENEGAYTGEVSAKILSKYKLKYCIVGHSERLIYFNETYKEISKKIKNLVINSITPVLCIGEKEELSINNKKKILKEQFQKCIDDNEVKDLILAYEPVWAFGTGKSLNINEAEEIINYLKESFKYNFVNLRVQYGGSVNSSNIRNFFQSTVIDGVLLGKASISLKEFKNILEGCE